MNTLLNCLMAFAFAAVASALASVVTVPLLGWPWGAFVAEVTAVGVLTVSGEGEVE